MTKILISNLTRPIGLYGSADNTRGSSIAKAALYTSPKPHRSQRPLSTLRGSGSAPWSSHSDVLVQSTQEEPELLTTNLSDNSMGGAAQSRFAAGGSWGKCLEEKRSYGGPRFAPMVGHSAW